METRANFVAIGAFVLAVIFAGFGFVYWLSTSRDTGKRSEVVIVFDGAVTGLGVGGPVLFNGIKIGEVSKLSLDPQNPARVLALARVDNTVPLKVDSKAELGYQGLTGVAHIQLKGGSANAQPLFAGDKTPVIKADLSAFDNLIEGAQTLVKKANSTLDIIQEVTTENREAVANTVKNVEKFSDALAKNSDGVDTFLADVAEAARTVSGLSDRISGFVKEAEGLVASVDREKIAKVVDNAVTVSDSLAAASGDFDQVIADFRKTAEQLSTFGENLNATLAKVDGVVSEIDRESVKTVVANIETLSSKLAARADDIDAFIVEARGSAENINKLTGALADRDGDISAIVTDVRDVAAEAKAFSAKLNTTMDDVKGVIAAVDPEKVKTVVTNVEEFTTTLNGHKGDIDTIMTDARGAVADVKAFTTGLQGNREDVDHIVKSAREFADKMNGVGERVDSLIAKVESMVDADGKGFISEATEAARSIAKAADAFAKRADTIAAGLERFSTRGLQNLDSAISQTRQTLTIIQRTFSDLDRDPSQLIFGGSSTPQYKPRRR